MHQSLLAISIVISLGSLSQIVHTAPTPPELMLAEEYRTGTNISDYWVSEKLDGVRALWNGRQLISRGGHIINAPQWFIENLPSRALDGELWAGHANFDHVSSVIRKKTPDDDSWKSIKFMVFDLPRNLERFDSRLAAIEEIVKGINKPHIQAVNQFRLSTKEQLQAKLDEIDTLGGEGLMLHHSKSLYQAKRSFDLQKLKKYQDSEATVIAHLPGKGKFTGLMGSVLVKNKDGLQFKIGSGFTEVERRTPPSLGSKITYRFRGKTKNGLPRFATFLRTYEEL